MSIRFHEDDVREMGRTADGVKGIDLDREDYVIGMVAINRESATLLVVSERGMGKRSEVSEYRVTEPRRQGHHHLPLQCQDRGADHAQGRGG